MCLIIRKLNVCIILNIMCTDRKIIPLNPGGYRPGRLVKVTTRLVARRFILNSKAALRHIVFRRHNTLKITLKVLKNCVGNF